MDRRSRKVIAKYIKNKSFSEGHEMRDEMTVISEVRNIINTIIM